MPDFFSSVTLVAVQIGFSLTAVIAQFDLSKDGSRYIDREWNGKHEPMLIRKHGYRPRAYDRLWASMIKTQTARNDIQDSARKWLSNNCPGFFASHGKKHPVVDLLLFDQFNPLRDELEKGCGDSFRAIGLDLFSNLLSPDLPGLVILPVSDSFDGSVLHDCWAIAGNRVIAADGIKNQRDGYGDDDARALLYVHRKAASYFILLRGIISYLTTMLAQYATKRDTMRTTYHKHKMKSTSMLRKELLSDSLDIAEVSRDARRPWEPSWRQWCGISISSEPSPQVKMGARDAKDYKVPDVIEEMGLQLNAKLDRLVEDDQTFRGILASVSSLGASNVSLKLGRVALIVFLVSLMVSLVTLLVSGVSENTILEALLSFR